MRSLGSISMDSSGRSPANCRGRVNGSLIWINVMSPSSGYAVIELRAGCRPASLEFFAIVVRCRALAAQACCLACSWPAWPAARCIACRCAGRFVLGQVADRMARVPAARLCELQTDRRGRCCRIIWGGSPPMRDLARWRGTGALSGCRGSASALGRASAGCRPAVPGAGAAAAGAATARACPRGARHRPAGSRASPDGRTTTRRRPLLGLASASCPAASSTPRWPRRRRAAARCSARSPWSRSAWARSRPGGGGHRRAGRGTALAARLAPPRRR